MPDNLSDGIKRYSIREPGKTFFNNILEHLLLTPARTRTALPPGGGSPTINVAFNMQHQLRTYWCWAATATSVSLFYNSLSIWTQCSIAAATLSNTCCQTPDPCDKPWYLNEALTKTGNFVNYGTPLSFSDVEKQLKTGRVIGCRIGWQDSGGHFVVIHGCRSDAGINYYSIDDPSTGKSETTENGFHTAYLGSGTWTHSFITKP